MAKVNNVKPSMREKKRYLCFEIGKMDNSFSKREVERAILTRVKLWIGEKNFGLGRPELKIYDQKYGIGIISCNHKQYLDIRMGIMLTEKINDVKVKIIVFSVSGIIKKAKKRLEEKIKNGTIESSNDGI